MSTPKISFKVPKEATEGSADADVQGDVTAHDLSSAPGKEREREPVFGGDIANISNEGQQAMDVDETNGGASSLRLLCDGCSGAQPRLLACSHAICAQMLLRGY